jgi:hypothetical protein
VTTKAREYVSLAGLGDFTHLQKQMREYTTVVRALSAGYSARRASFEARILFSIADVENEFLDLNEIIPHSKGLFPVLWVNLTYDPDRLSQDEITFIEQKFSLELLGVIESEEPFQ